MYLMARRPWKRLNYLWQALFNYIISASLEQKEGQKSLMKVGFRVSSRGSNPHLRINLGFIKIFIHKTGSTYCYITHSTRPLNTLIPYTTHLRFNSLFTTKPDPLKALYIAFVRNSHLYFLKDLSAWRIRSPQ